ncbi:hypothetical protein ACWGI9_42705 [Streptomyces sp. NPDC054833]
MSEPNPTTEATQATTPSWQLHLGRNGLRLHAGRHLTLDVSMPLLAWIASFSGLLTTAGHWLHLLP